MPKPSKFSPKGLQNVWQAAQTPRSRVGSPNPSPSGLTLEKGVQKGGHAVRWYSALVHRTFRKTPRFSGTPLEAFRAYVLPIFGKSGREKLTPEEWSKFYDVMEQIILGWDVYLKSRAGKGIENPPAHPPLQWAHSWWESWDTFASARLAKERPRSYPSESRQFS